MNYDLLIKNLAHRDVLARYNEFDNYFLNYRFWLISES